jgi:hypothetical protein
MSGPAGAKPGFGGAPVCKGTLEAVGHLEPIEFTADVQDFTDRAVTMTADLVVDRLRFGMTWSPMRIAAYDAWLRSPRGSFAPDASHLRGRNGHPPGYGSAALGCCPRRPSV